MELCGFAAEKRCRTVERISNLAKIIGLPPQAHTRLKEALTHRTFAVEHGLNFDNQRLEFLGDAVLEMIHTDYLFQLYPELPEGDLTKIRSALSCETMLADLARKIELGKYLLIGRGEIGSGGNDRDSTLADLFEAVLGAIYLEAGFEFVSNFVINLFKKYCPDPKEQLLYLNPKGRLQELSQRRWGVIPEYRLLRQSGLQHQPLFEVELKVANLVAVGSGGSRKLAEIAAASNMCRYLKAGG